MSELTFLKLGGSLITDKDRPRTPRTVLIHRIAGEIAQARKHHPEMKLVIGHGSGSYGHWSAGKYQTHKGVHTQQEWFGFQEVWRDARQLNDLVVATMDAAGVPVIAFPPSACAQVKPGGGIAWNIAPIRMALDSGLVPLVYGDVVFHSKIGGTILSTEAVFRYLADPLIPDRILLAGIEPGVWQDYPEKSSLFPLITRASLPEVEKSLNGSASPDVTGGMLAKVIDMLDFVESVPHLEIIIFSGLEPGAIYQALCTDITGTRINHS